MKKKKKNGAVNARLKGGKEKKNRISNPQPVTKAAAKKRNIISFQRVIK